MDLADRIQRRRTGRIDDRLVVDWDPLNPAYHLDEPIGRAALVEAVLDAIDPVFDDRLPSSVYLWGPAGAGKSAITTAIMRALREELASPGATYTATRGRSSMGEVRYVYVDGRRVTSRFKLYHQLLDGMRIERVPRRGIGTEDLIDQISQELSECVGAVLAIDHVSGPGSVGLSAVQEYLEAFEDVALIAVGRRAPEEYPLPIPAEQVYIPPYTYELIEVLTVRGARGLSQPLDHVHARHIAEWADGNAHDALAGLYVSALIAEDDGASRLEPHHIERALEEVPRDSIPMGRLLALSETEQAVLNSLVQERSDEEIQIDTIATRIAGRSDLTSNTVKRMLYELAQVDVLERVEVSVEDNQVGRRPSTVRPNFSSRAFQHVISG